MKPERMTVKGSDYYDWLLSIPREKVICIDTETTGLDPKKDEIRAMPHSWRCVGALVPSTAATHGGWRRATCEHAVCI